MVPSRIAGAVVLLALAALASSTTLRMKRQPHTFVAGATQGTGFKPERNSIFMNGGVLTLGGYYINITVGTGAGKLTFDAIVDTGSSNTAIPSAGCTNCGGKLYYAGWSPTAESLYCRHPMCQNCVPTEVSSAELPYNWDEKGKCRYGHNTCDPLRLNQCTFGISYGGSSSATAGTITQDFACLGDTCAMVYIDQITHMYPAATQPTGLVGFAFPANGCNPTCQPTILDSFVAGGKLDKSKNLFGMCLTPSSGGYIDIGFLDASRYSGALQYTKVVKEHWYNLEVLDILVGNVSIGVPKFLYGITNDGIGSFVDSGTSILLVPPYAMDKLTDVFMHSFGGLPGLKDFFGPTTCAMNITKAQVTMYPEVSVVMKGFDGQPDFPVTMSGKNYLMPVGGGQRCLGIAGVSGIGVILGDIIMENYYIAFDRVGARVGFAPVKSC